jgi:hypothetical protein
VQIRKVRFGEPIPKWVNRKGWRCAPNKEENLHRSTRRSRRGKNPPGKPQISGLTTKPAAVLPGRFQLSQRSNKAKIVKLWKHITLVQGLGTGVTNPKRKPISMKAKTYRHNFYACEQFRSGARCPLFVNVQDTDVAGSIFGGFFVSANSVGGFGSATAPIREPFLNWFR